MVGMTLGLVPDDHCTWEPNRRKSFSFPYLGSSAGELIGIRSVAPTGRRGWHFGEEIRYDLRDLMRFDSSQMVEPIVWVV